MFISNPPLCLQHFITLKDGCYCDSSGLHIETPVPKSGFYLETLNGITVENISDITNEANKTATNLVSQSVYFASFLVERQLLSMLNAEGLNLNKIGANREYCSVSNNYSLPAVGVDKGIRISRAAISSTQSRIYVSNIKIKSKTAGQTTLKIEDTNGVVLWSKVVQLLQDVLMQFEVNQSFEAEIIFILADASNVRLYEFNCHGPAGCCGDAIIGRKEISIMGFDGMQNSFTGYLSACIRLDCTDKDIICRFKDRLALAILYQTGVEILKEWLSPSSRINIIKISGKEWAGETITEWLAMVGDLIKAETKNIASMIMQDKYCYECNNTLKSFTKLPS